MGRHDDAVRAIERYRGAWPMDERLQESLDNMLLDLYKHSRDLGAFSSITLVPVRPRWRGERRSLRTFFPALSPPRVPRFQSRRTHLDAFQLRF